MPNQGSKNPRVYSGSINKFARVALSPTKGAVGQRNDLFGQSNLKPLINL